MADTPNHEYNVPDQGTQDWHVPLNENFEAFEVDIELRDTEANLGNYTPTAGAKFLATDTGVVYTGDGNTWVPQFVLPGYDTTTDEATLAVSTLSGSLTGGASLTTIAGNNLSIDSNGQLNASTGGGSGGGISNLSGGDGIAPGNIGDGDTLSVAWGDANDLDSDGNVTGGGGSGIQNLSGGDGINPDSIGDGDTLSVAWGNAGTLDADGNVDDWSGAADLDASGSLTLSVVQTLNGGDGISPGSIGDGDTLSVAWGDANDLDGDGNVTSQNWTVNSDLLAPSDSSIAGIDVDEVNAGALQAGNSPLKLTVNGARVLSMTGEANGDAGNVVAGHSVNGVSGGSVGATIGGGGESGSPNKVTGDYGTVAGGYANEAHNTATVGGGNQNKATKGNTTVGGGLSNTASGNGATIAGGLFNTAGSTDATVGGGSTNTASANRATVAGGRTNTASESHATVGGGSFNEASGQNATVPGGSDNQAGGTNSFAAGNQAKATNDGTFVWADSQSGNVSSTADNAFLVWANGGTGIGTTSPVTTFHVRDEVAESGGDNLGRHVAAIENTSQSSSPVPDMLGLEFPNISQPTQFNSYISFMDSTGTIGNIQGDGNGGVEFTGSVANFAADFAECFPKADPNHEFEDATLVGLCDGEVVALAAETDPDAVMVVSTAPLVTGNRPEDSEDRDDYVALTLLGQVPVRVSESVTAGDVLVASPDDAGTAVAQSDSDLTDQPVVGLALESAEAGDQARTLVRGPGFDSGPTDHATGTESAESDGTNRTQKERLDALEAENEQLNNDLAEKDQRIDDLEAENEQLRERLAAVEEHLASIDSGGASPATADD